MTTASLQDVSKIFPEHVAVDHISLDISDGEFVVLVGPSGCGKSTTLRMVAGLEQATSGNILIDGMRVNEVSPRDRDVAMVFQNYALYPHLSVYENLAYALRRRRVPRPEIDERVKQAAKSIHLEELLKRRPAQLSGGQRQRVALGRAIVRQPKLFLMDEPLSNLDAKLRGQTRSEITRLQRELGVTTLYVTHDQTEAMTMGSKIVVMNEGRIQQIATPRILYDNPANTFVAQFMGTPAMNLLTCNVDKGAADLTLLGAGIRITFEKKYSTNLRTASSSGKIIVGFRPEDVTIANNESSSDISGTVLVVEDLGHESLVLIQNNDSKFTVRLSPENGAQVRPGEVISFCIDRSRLRYFDQTTGGAIASIGG
ncbi:sn-glycerol-3-phosphate ABC transporter ATP-binding protein UgpC [Planktomarina temperata]|jgi:multiple sugar transport system ATP-binding protein|nr:sn-glycerol-3-phosphate ABC transporter ATP-binding protein UgpC [Planktomarina temperata]